MSRVNTCKRELYNLPGSLIRSAGWKLTRRIRETCGAAMVKVSLLAS
jgi:hypothetical protein